MAVTPTGSPKSETLNIMPIRQQKVDFCIVSESPLYFNRMQEKALRTFLIPGRKVSTDAERLARGLKHNPPVEYRGSVYRDQTPNGPTRCVFPSPALKGAMSTAALDIPGARKAEIGRLVWVEGYSRPIWGVPKLKMDIVHSADIQRTPDVRTRAFLPEWCSVLTVSFVKPKLTEELVAVLLSGGGILCGIGDYRQEKGKGDYGRFRLCSPDDPDFLRIQATGGRAAQDAALLNPEPADLETEEMLGWFYDGQGMQDVANENATSQPKRPRRTAA